MAGEASVRNDNVGFKVGVRDSGKVEVDEVESRRETAQAKSKKQAFGSDNTSFEN